MSVEEMVDFCTGVIGVNVADFLDEIVAIDDRDQAAVATLRPCPLAVAAMHGRRPSGITVARTFHGSAVPRTVQITCPTAHFLVTVALIDADLSIAHDDRRLIDGKISLGTVCATGPGGRLTIMSRTPCDLIHLAVPEALMRRSGKRRADFVGVVLCDRLIGRLVRLLGEAPPAWLRVYADLLSQLTVARLVQMMPGTPVSPLPGWRLKPLRGDGDHVRAGRLPPAAAFRPIRSAVRAVDHAA